jgi:hypothetical protein
MGKIILKNGASGFEAKEVSSGSGIDVNEALTVNGELSISSGYSGKRRVVALTDATLAPSQAQSGTIFVFDGSACTVTLPQAAAGLEFMFVVDTTQTGDAVITTQTADGLAGALLSTTAALNSTNLAVGTSIIDSWAVTIDTLTMNGTTQGGVVGSYIHCIALSATMWHVSGVKIHSGNAITSAS